jgi:predicted neuraminidase
MRLTFLRRNALLCLVGLAYCAVGTRTSGQSLIEKLADGKIRASSIPGLQIAYLPIILPSSHASNLLRLSDGDLLCAYYSGRWEGESGTAIVLSRLPKGSNEWTRPVVVARETGSALENPVLFEPSVGTLRLFYTAQAGGAGQSNAQIFSRTSTDGGKTWAAPRPLFSKPGSFDRQPLVVAGGQWLFPMYYTPKSDADNYSAIEISADQGQTWKECAVQGSNGLVQPGVVELSPRNFIAFFRSRFADWVYTSNSQDGCSWTTPRPSRIPNNNSSIQVARLGDGHLVIAFNNIQAATTRGKPQDTARWPLSVALSIDDGQTWPWVRDVDIGQEVPQEPVPDVMAGVDVRDEKKNFFYHLIDYSYPSVIQAPDGTIHLSYTYRRRAIKCASFDENWIKDGTTLGFFSGDH